MTTACPWRKALRCEVGFVGLSVVPVATMLYLARPFRSLQNPQGLSMAFLPAILLLTAIPLCCGFHASPHADWMMENTLPRLVWYISIIPLSGLVDYSRWSRSAPRRASVIVDMPVPTEVLRI